MIYTSLVKKGFGRGKKMGYPTFNLEIPERFDYQYGIYAAKVRFKGREFAGALHFGPIPTFDYNNPVLEIFILDYDSDEPVEQIDFEIIGYLREIRKFDNADQLSAQITDDVAFIKQKVLSLSYSSNESLSEKSND